jgi:hypothetical protein
MVLQPRHRLLALDGRDALVRISQSSGIRSHTGMVAHRDPNDFLHIGRANDATSGSKQPMALKKLDA